MPQRTVDPSRCEKRRPYCDLSCPRLSATSPGTIRIQASRKYVADHYDDGERAWNKDQAVEDKQGDWPEAVQISQSSEPWPTEEILTQIVFYTQSLESTYNEEKTKEVMPLLNKILILQQKDGKIEYVIDRFVSV